MFYKSSQPQILPDIFAENALGEKEGRGSIFGIPKEVVRGVYKEMNTWYSMSLGDGMMAAVPTAEIEEKFLQAFTASGKPPEMAVFTRAESEGRLHCEVMAYFSPAAADVANKFNAEPCGKPARAGLGLLAGDERAWSVLFPESDQRS